MLRKIKTADVGLIIEMLHALHEESPHYNTVMQDEQYVRNNLASMIEHPAFIGSIDADLRGFMFGQATAKWFDPEVNAYELLLYILPEYRGGLLAARLIKQFEIDAKRLGCVHVRAGTSTQISTEEVLRLYERLGYTREANTATKRIN
ncbi:GNAT family N-acetyltransferase [Bradyrhizobium sp. LTSP885]|uniref:GNAT family N-acetyltransferase n=1 Tax=Bradyrhizobium sp. LTSP885 TaxID=1619232 RepID=UPI00069BD5BE|nr:GNAT family N-acetyltransferase [Bradyrhizobium sp. LTSP885]